MNTIWGSFTFGSWLKVMEELRMIEIGKNLTFALSADGTTEPVLAVRFLGACTFAFTIDTVVLAIEVRQSPRLGVFPQKGGVREDVHLRVPPTELVDVQVGRDAVVGEAPDEGRRRRVVVGRRRQRLVEDGLAAARRPHDDLHETGEAVAHEPLDDVHQLRAAAHAPLQLPVERAHAVEGAGRGEDDGGGGEVGGRLRRRRG